MGDETIRASGPARDASVPGEAAAAAAPLVSILLAVRDGARFLPQALASIDAQTYRPLELLAVDDGSEDNTESILRDFAAARTWVRVLRAGGVGPAGARAVAFAASRGAFIAIHDADDESRPERLERQVNHLLAHPEIGVLGTAADVMDARGATLAPYPVPRGGAALRRQLRRSPPFVHGSVLMRREAYEAAGGFRAIFRCAEDYDLWLRMPSRFLLENLPQPFYRWRLHGGNTFSMARDLHLKYLAVALAFQEERASRGEDSAALLEVSATWGDFMRAYPRADRVALRWGEALVREGRTSEARRRLGRAFRASRSAIPAAGVWLLSWPVGLLPRARRARATRDAAASGNADDKAPARGSGA